VCIAQGDAPLSGALVSLMLVPRVAQWLEQRRKDLVILATSVRIPLRDVGASLSDETI
jgi:hypothetical protein